MLSSIGVYVMNRKKASIVLLLMGAASLFVFAAILDPFLNLWDERFHALVAKNMMSHPLEPMLYRETLFNLDYSQWGTGHIWLHKQPLFMWQMALGFKLFGVAEFTMRLPSILLLIATTFAVYKTGKNLIGASTGYIAALLFVSSFYLVELTSGRQMLDQNDISFLSYTSLSIWSWTEYVRTRKLKWLLFIGLFSGAAMLCKWFVGLLVYLGWGVQVLISKPRIRDFSPILLSFLITVLVFVPWQIYVFTQFPEQAQIEWKYNSLHFTVPVEAHDGPWWYHFDQMSVVFGIAVPWLLLLGIFMSRKFIYRGVYYGFLSMLVGVELFFALAATKMPSFTVVLVLPVFVISAIPIARLMDWLLLQKQKTLIQISIVLLLMSMIVLRIDIEKLQETHTEWRNENVYTRQLTYNRNVFQQLSKDLNENAVVFNVLGRHYVELMFYTDALATNQIPTEHEIERLVKVGKKVYVFVDDRVEVPGYILENDQVEKLHIRLQGYL